MADIGKKVVFEAVDNGLLSMFDRAKQKAGETYNSIIKKSEELNLSTKDQIKYIEQSIKALEREASEQMKNRRSVLAISKQQDLLNSRHPSQTGEFRNVSKIQEDYRSNEIQIKKDAENQALYLNSLKESLLKTKNLKSGFSVTSKFRSDDEQKSINNEVVSLNEVKDTIKSVLSQGQTKELSNQFKGLVDEFFTSNESLNEDQVNKFFAAVKQKDKNIDTDSLSDKIAAVLTKQDSVTDNKSPQEESVENLIEKTNQLLLDQNGLIKKGEDSKKQEDKKLTPEEQLNKKILDERKDQHEKVKEGKKEKETSTFMEVLKANLVTEGIKKLYEFGKDKVAGLTQSQGGEDFLAETISEVNPLGIPIGAFIGGGLGRRNKEQFRVEQAESRLAGLTGKFDAGFTNDKSVDDELRFGSIKGAESYGYGIGETLEAREAFSRSLNKRVKTNDAFDALALEKNFSLSRGTISNQFETSRLSMGGISPIENVAQILEKIPSLKIDSTELEDVLKLQSTLIQKNSDVIEKANRASTTDIISRFKSIDSEFFSNPVRLAPLIASINQSLQNPQNDFAKARSFKVLSELNPDASYFDLIKSQSEGINSKGFLQKTLEDLTRSVGGGKNLMTSLTGKQFGGAGVLNLSPAQSEALVKAFEKNPELFANFGGDENELLNQIGMKDRVSSIRSGATGKVTVREEEQVKIADEFVFGIQRGTAEVGKQMAHSFVTELKKMDISVLGVNIGEKIASYIEGYFHESPEKGKNGVHLPTHR